MYIEINGIELPILVIEEWLKEQVYDDAQMNYMFERNHIVVTTHVSPDNLTIPTGGRINTRNFNASPSTPSNLFLDLIQKLREPRKKVRIFYRDDESDFDKQNVIFEAPLGTLKTDLDNGPRVTNVQVIPEGGQSTVCLRISIEAAIPAYAGLDAPVVMSNIWKMTFSYGEQYEATRMVEGRAHLRKDLLVANKVSVDSLRKQILFPIPVGYMRSKPEISLSEGGTIVDYRFMDTQQLKSTAGGIQFGITYIQVLEQRGYSSPASLSKSLGKMGAVIFG